MAYIISLVLYLRICQGAYPCGVEVQEHIRHDKFFQIVTNTLARVFTTGIHFQPIPIFEDSPRSLPLKKKYRSILYMTIFQIMTNTLARVFANDIHFQPNLIFEDSPRSLPLWSQTVRTYQTRQFFQIVTNTLAWVFANGVHFQPSPIFEDSPRSLPLWSQYRNIVDTTILFRQ